MRFGALRDTVSHLKKKPIKKKSLRNMGIVWKKNKVHDGPCKINGQTCMKVSDPNFHIRVVTRRIKPPMVPDPAAMFPGGGADPVAGEVEILEAGEGAEGLQAGEGVVG